MICALIPSKTCHSEGKNFLEHFIVLQGSWVTKANNFLGEIEELNGAVCISGHVRKTSLMLQINSWDSACAAVGRDWVCLSVSPEDCHWVWSEFFLPSQQLELLSTSIGQIWVRDSGIIPIWDVLLPKTYTVKGMFALPLWRQLFNLVGNLILPPEQNILEIHMGIQILTWENLISLKLSAGFLFV